MVINVGINGFGRIGRVIFRTCCQHPDLEIVAINDPAIELSYICYLIKFDSTHGKYNGTVSYEGDEIKINDHSIKVFHHKAPCDIPWEKAGVQYVIEASGMFTNMEKASGHLASEGVRRVLVTAPSSDVPMLILGVNQDRINPDVKVISCTSSTLYCLAPIIKLLQDEFGVGEGFITSIHAMTPSLKPLDGLCIRGKHWRDHRSIHQNIIPAATGACKALDRIIPAVRDKLAGLAFRVPIVNVSVLDLCIRLNKNTTVKEITECIEKVKDPALQGIIQVSKEQAVSSDFIGDSHSCTLDVDSSLQLRPNFFKLICWYENEFSYACRVVDTILYSERQRSLIFTPLTKMTFVRPIFWKTNCEQTDNRKHTGVDCASISKFPLSPCDSCDARSPSRPIQRPLSPYVSEVSKLSKRTGSLDETKTFRAFIEKYAKSGSVKDKINLHENSAAMKQIFNERVTAQERLESVKQEFSRMVKISEGTLKKQSTKHSQSVLANKDPSEESTEQENFNVDPSVLTIKSSTKGINANENSNSVSPQMTTTPSDEVRGKENFNNKLSGTAIRSLTKETTAKENLNSRLSGSTIKSSARGITEGQNIKAHSHRTDIVNLSKGTTENETSNSEYLSKRATRSSSTAINETEPLNDHSLKGVTGTDNYKSGLAIKTLAKRFSGKENFNVQSSRTWVKSPSRAITISDKEYSSTYSSRSIIKSPSKGTTDRGYSNVHVCSLPMRRLSKETPMPNCYLTGLTTRKSSKDITENENLHNHLATVENKSPSKEKQEIEKKPFEKDVRKTVTDSTENENEGSNCYFTEPSTLCKEAKTDNVSSISIGTKDSNDKDSIKTINKSINEKFHKELQKLDSPVTNKAGNLVGLNVLGKIYQTHENNNMSFISENIVKTNRNNNILWDKIAKPNHTENTHDSNTVNKLADNQSSTSNVNSSIFDENDDIDEKHNVEEVIQIVSENPERAITFSNLNIEVDLNVNESKELLMKYSSDNVETVDRENVKALTAELLNRRISKIEIVDEKLKQRNIVLVEDGKEKGKYEIDTNQKKDTAPSHAGDYCEDAYKKISRNQEEDENSCHDTHDSNKTVSEMTSLCVSPVNTMTTISNHETYRSKQDIYDKLDSVSVSGSENSFQMLEKKSQIINITDLTYSLDDLDRLDKICRIIEISDELSEKLFAPLDGSSEGGSGNQKWSFKDLCKRIKLDEFCNNVFGKTSM